MPTKATTEKAKRKLRSGKSPSTAAGEFVREEIHHVREGKHGARSARQAIAIGLSKARRAGVPLAPPRKGQASEPTRQAAARDLAASKRRKPAQPKRARASKRALQHEPRKAASHAALSAQARSAGKRSRAQRGGSRRTAVR